MSKPQHLPSEDLIYSWKNRSAENPLKILVSACLWKGPTTTDGTSVDIDYLHSLFFLPNVALTSFCPEDFTLGTPRETPDIHGGNGFDVLDGSARVKTESGRDVTAEMLKSAHHMLELAKLNKIDVAIMLDMSGSCGSQVISLGNRFDKDRKYQLGPGVSAALLIRNGFPVISHRDHKTLSLMRSCLDSSHITKQDLLDHHEHPWTKEYFSL
jgi:uncharacterized protein YbbK (DUF523 family)